ncbi:MAG: RagB/SusD family nutrient uptake outer membrane protein [Haliscomenobacteraceae bacterium CHB4]|nr:hypothetical protein [Saprospiraceae bacterium]MCE7925525.1 RagB/SusD family nutrient uptake outer membrane protein [Haliscomenobacteraceae bacterium CHB4]
MKNLSNKLLLLVSIALTANLLFSACSESFLEVEPTGALTDELLSSRKGLDGLLVGAYSPLTGLGDWYGGHGNWVHGSIRGGDANKGTDAGDQAVANPLQRYEALPNNDAVASKWRLTYEGVARCNTLLRLVNSTEDPTVTDDDKKRISAEARFLRGLYYFELVRIWKNVPYVDENMTAEEAVAVKNDQDVYPKIEADFQYAWDNLPEVQTAAGRANKWAAGAYLAKVYLYQGKHRDAKGLFDQVIANGVTSGGDKYGLLDNYSDVFNASFDNNKETVFAVQHAVNTGSTNNASHEFVLNYPYGSGSDIPAGCCGFFQPSFELVNSFRVDANGLPLLDGSYNNAANAVKNDQGLTSAQPFTPDAGPLDPRLDHSVGRRSIPYLDWIDHPGASWIRDQNYAGPYSPKKYVFRRATQNSVTDGSSWTRGWTSQNTILMRFADVLLMAAECEIDADNGSLEKAREYVNLVRARAANPGTWVKRSDGSNAANYVIGLYNTPWADKDAARAAVRFERKLELSGEGHRFFDLVRWGIAATAITAYLQHDGAILTSALGGATFGPEDELYPIPQSQIDIHGADILKQNPGY